MKMKMKMACLLLFFLFAFPVSHSSPFSYSDKDALLAFKSSLSPDSHKVLHDWSSDSSLCNWTGVSCSSRHQRVVSLNLTGMSLVGTISPFLGNLSFLRVLALWNNSFYGQVPTQLGRLFRLRILRLSKNELEGFIPSTLADCRSLQRLILSYNNLSGNIPSELGLLSYLEILALGRNQLTGKISPSLGNLSSLTVLDLTGNRLYGDIPIELGMLVQLKELCLGENNLLGVIPTTLSNCTQLQVLKLYANELSGHIPWKLGNLSELRKFLSWGNQLTGEIPTSLSNCTQLQKLDLDYNQLRGTIPLEFGKLLQLQRVSIMANNLTSKNNELSFLTGLTNCSSLQKIDLSHNYLTGILPSSISQLSSQLYLLSLNYNKIGGNIPNGIGNLTKLETLDLSDNHFNGTIPSTLGQLLNLERLYLDRNNLCGGIPISLDDATRLGLLSLSENIISGQIPDALGNLSQLRYLILHHNQLSGKVPASLGRCVNLLAVDLSYNKLEGNIPLEWTSLVNLQFYFNVSSNLLQGSISVMNKMAMVQAIDISLNNFSGEIPEALSICTNLQYLNLSWNSFYSSIPISLTNVKNLETIDLSRNNLSGTIPLAFQEMKMLKHINLSSNKLIGEVPKEGVFAMIDESDVSGNVGLCGEWINLPPCLDSKHKQFSTFKKVIIPIIIGIAIFIMSSILLLIFYRRGHIDQNALGFNIGPTKISYEELADATSGFSQTNQLGVGSFGSVYKGVLNNSIHIVVKVFNFQDENAVQSFQRECNVLKRVRHRNVIKIISAYCNPNFKALVLPFMSNGSLERCLYPEGGEECKLSLADRLKIAKEIAQGMEYLHHYCFVQVIHCDLKPNNVLLGDDMTPYIADFGITRLFFENSMNSVTSASVLKGSIGYFAPEYGMGGKISTKGDVYSYGILLLELLTRKRPTNNMFVEGINLPKWASMHFPNKITEVVDNQLLRDVQESNKAMVLACLTEFMQIGLICTREDPLQRPTMMETVQRLEKITSVFLGTPRTFHLPIDISPFLEGTSNLRNTNEGSSQSWSTSTS